VSLSGRAAINVAGFVQRKLVTVVAAITFAIAPVPVAFVAWRRPAPVIVAAPAGNVDHITVLERTVHKLRRV